jgi:pyruvate dehydrogenase E2 component (dihydrolipoamide acetyltransferase)
MIVEVKLPEISENVHEGDVIKVLVSPGDTVAVDQPLVELETEKAVFEVPSTVAGLVTEVTVKAGDTISEGAVIAKVDTEAKKGASAPAAPRPAPLPAEPTRPSAPASQPTAAPIAETIRDTVVAVAQEQGSPAAASPTVRRLARELGVDVNRVRGTGPGGRITSEDVHAYAKSIITAAASGVAPQASAGGGASTTVTVVPRALPDFARFGEIERTPMSKVRAITTQSMAYAWNTVPHVTQHDEADITALEAARAKYAPRVEAAGGKLTLTSILAKVCASALRKFPDFNASVDIARNEIIHKKYVNIGIAVDTDRGLLVPVVRHVDRKNLVAISVEITQLADKARHKRIMPDDLEGGNFTVSNLGGIGGVGFTPIVYAPEVAILGVSRASMKPVYVDDKFQPRLLLPLSLSYDHRLIDGAVAARFLRWVCEALEDPILLALEG